MPHDVEPRAKGTPKVLPMVGSARRAVTAAGANHAEGRTHERD